MRRNSSKTNKLILIFLTIALSACSGKKKDESQPEGAGVSGNESINTPTQTTTTTLNSENTTISSTTTSSSTTIPEVTTTTIGQNSSTTTTTNPSTATSSSSTTSLPQPSSSTTTMPVSSTSTTVPSPTSTTLPIVVTTSSTSTTTTSTTVPAPQHVLRFTSQPTNTEIYSIMNSVRVELRDENNNVINESISVTLTISTGILFGTVSKITTNGAVTFSDLQIREIGTYTISASASGYTSSTSDSFNVINGINAGLSGVALWIKADSISANNGDKVCNLNEWSTSRNNLSELNSQYCPTYNSNAVNGKPGLVFNGLNQLATDNNVDLTSTSNASVFTVVSTDNSSLADQVFLEQTSNYNSGSGGFALSIFPSFFCSYCVSSSQKVFSSYALSVSNNNSFLINQAYSFSSIFSSNSGSITIRLNGSVNSQSTFYNSSPYYFANDRIHIGARNGPIYGLSGKIMEVIIFNRELTPSEIQTVESLISIKYGLW